MQINIPLNQLALHCYNEAHHWCVYINLTVTSKTYVFMVPVLTTFGLCSNNFLWL